MKDLWYEADVIVMHGDFKKFRRLVERKKNIIKLKNKDGNTLLHLVARYVEGKLDEFEYDYIPFIKYLLEKGLDINTQNNEGKTPLDLSIRFGCSRETIFLLNHGAKSGNMNLKQLSDLLVGVNDFKFPEDYNYDPLKEVKLICGVLDAYNKCKEVCAESFKSNATPRQDIKNYEFQIDNYLNELYDICSKEEGSNLLETVKEYFDPNSNIVVMISQSNSVFNAAED